MTINAAFLGMMGSTVTIYASSTVDEYGKVSYSASGTSVSCRIVPTTKVIRNANGKDVVSTGTIYCYGNPTVSTNSKILLPDASQATVLSVEVQNDENGAHHTKIAIGVL